MRTAILFNDSGRADDALNLLHELQARAGDDGKQLGETFMLEAELLNRRKRGDDAVAVYDRGLQALPDDTRLDGARALLNDDLDHGAMPLAGDHLRRVLELKPDDADADERARLHPADREFDQETEALALIEQALKLKPGEPAIIDSLGWAQYRLGKFSAAVHELVKRSCQAARSGNRRASGRSALGFRSERRSQEDLGTGSGEGQR